MVCVWPHEAKAACSVCWGYFATSQNTIGWSGYV